MTTPQWRGAAPVSDASSTDKEALLAEAARAASTGELADLHVGDLLCYLRAYYRHVPVEDLAAAGPAAWPRPR